MWAGRSPQSLVAAHSVSGPCVPSPGPANRALLPADFCQLSGMHLLVGRYLEAGAAGLRWRAAQLIGTCSQNVAAIQEQVLGLGALRKLLRLLDRDACDSVRVKALFAISCEHCVWGKHG